MKKVLLLMAMLTIGLASINAQDNLRWGATVGMNSSNFSITGFDSKIGFHAGVKAEVGLPQISEGVYLDMGALLTLKGAKNRRRLCCFYQVQSLLPGNSCTHWL